MEALELYGIEKPLVEAAALEERSLRTEDLVISTVALDAGGIRDLIGKSDVVFNL